MVSRILARLAELVARAAHSEAAGSQPAVHTLSGGSITRFRRQQLDGVFAHVANAAFISSVLAFALAVYLAPAFGIFATHCWLAAKIFVSTARLGVALLYKRTTFFAGRDYLAKRLTLALLVLDGSVWGFAGAWAVFGSAETACLVAAVLASVALMASAGLGTMAAAGAAVNIPMLASVATAIAFRGDAIGLFGSAGITLVLVQCLVTGRLSESRLRREYVAHEATANALGAAARNAEALEAALLEVKRQSAVKALFLGTMSHELRTPLHGILGLTQLVRARSTDPVNRHRLGLVESSGNHLLELIGALLDVSRIDSGRLELRETAFDLAGELRNIGELYQLRCESKGIGFQAFIDLEEPHMVVGDAARLRQVLHNLLGNAVKFTKTGLIILKVQRQDDQRYSFDVRDTGPGIASKDLGHIFEAFAQVDESATRPADGTGLGLTIARELARAMGGDISVSSALGVGSRFEFTAKLIDAQRTVGLAIEQSSDLPKLRQGYRVLLVEDNEVNALIATANLEAVGAEVIRAGDGKEAIALAFGDRRPDFILMDCRMPVMDGPTAAREIRIVEKATHLDHLPIVALTASPSEEDKRECYDAGMDGILVKPFNSEQLVQTISVYATGGVCNREHPLYEFARSLDDMEPDLFGGPAVH